MNVVNLQIYQTISSLCDYSRNFFPKDAIFQPSYQYQIMMIKSICIRSQCSVKDMKTKYLFDFLGKIETFTIVVMWLSLKMLSNGTGQRKAKGVSKCRQ